MMGSALVCLNSFVQDVLLKPLPSSIFPPTSNLRSLTDILPMHSSFIGFPLPDLVKFSGLSELMVLEKAQRSKSSLEN